MSFTHKHAKHARNFRECILWIKSDQTQKRACCRVRNLLKISVTERGLEKKKERACVVTCCEMRTLCAQKRQEIMSSEE